MSAGERLAAVSNRFYLRIRHPDAWRRATADGEGSFEALRGHKYCLLVTFRRSGEPVPTPVWFGLAEGRLYARSEAKVGKVKRIRNDARVLVAPCTVRGKPLGPATEGRARVLAREDEPRAEAALGSNYGLGRRLYERAGERLGLHLVSLEVSPAGGSA